MKQKALSSDERLRKQLLGKNARARLPSSTAGKKHRRNGDVAIENDNNDEEAGRAASFKSKRAAPMEKSKDAQSGKSKKIKGEEKEEDRRTVASDDADQDSETEQVQQPASSKSKAPRSYLDEILEKKAKKRKKRKKNHDQQASAKSGS